MRGVRWVCVGVSLGLLLACGGNELPRGTVTKPCDSSLPDGTPANIVRVPPRKPYTYATAGKRGYVVMTFDLDEFGAPQNLMVTDSQPPGVFDQLATEAVSQWRYCPTNPPRRALRVKLNFGK